MLKQRIITAIVLLAFLLPAVFYPDPTAFMGLAVVLIAAGAWEWANLNQCRPLAAYGIAAVSAVGCLVAWFFGFALLPYRGLWLMAGAAWVLVMVLVLKRMPGSFGGRTTLAGVIGVAALIWLGGVVVETFVAAGLGRFLARVRPELLERSGAPLPRAEGRAA